MTLKLPHTLTFSAPSAGVQGELEAVTSAPGSIGLLLIEDHLVMRAALRLLLDNCRELRVVGEAANRGEALSLCARLQPDVVLLDLDLADGSSVEEIPLLLEAAPAARVLVLTGMTDVALHCRALGRGAVGLVRKDQPPEVLLLAIERVWRGELWVEPTLMRSALSQNPLAQPVGAERGRRDIVGVASLTPREREIIAYVGQGLKSKQMAHHLYLSERTIHNHLASVFRKLDVSDRVELVLFAQRHGLLSLPAAVPP